MRQFFTPSQVASDSILQCWDKIAQQKLGLKKKKILRCGMLIRVSETAHFLWETCSVD